MLAKLLCAALLASAALVATAQNSLVVTTAKGQVQGYTSNGVDKWRGIPYAAAPVGDLRFAVPQEAAPWSGVKSALIAGAICPQIHVLGTWSGSEDCLFADVYAPANRDLSTPLPVLVWIYGGGWDFGDGIEFGLYNGDHFANLHEVVVVAFNYRLGPLGFLALPGSKAESPAGSVGSYGIYDQVAALKWVQENIGAFGGDPSQVTIAGESAGAFSTCIHLASPLSKGLFKNAILESGTCSSEIFFQSQASSMAWSQTYANITSCPSEGQSDAEVLACMRALTLDEVMGPSLGYSYTGYFPLMYPSMPWGSTIDGVLLTDRPFNVIANGEMNEVSSVIMGTNHDEGTLFATRLKSVVPSMHKPLAPGDMDLLMDHFFGSNATVNAMVDAAYPASDFGNTTQQIEVMLRDFFFLCPSSRAMLALGSYGVPTYLYQFVYKGDWIEDPSMGVYHSAELEFVFDNAWPPLIHTFSARDQSMADTFGYYWANQIKYSNPNGANGAGSPAQVTWPQYSGASLQSLSLDVPASVVEGLQESKCEMWDEIVQWTPPTPALKETIRRTITGKHTHVALE